MNTLIPVTRMLDAAFNGAFDTCATEDCTVRTSPRADVLEGDGEYRLVVELPGVSQENLDISVEQQTLTVKAERKQELPEGFKARRRERMGSASYVRTFNLGTGVDAEKIGARFEQGVLTITLPKSERSLPRRIEVQ